MANRARLCTGGENTLQKTRAGAEMELGVGGGEWPPELGPPGLETSVAPSLSSSALQPRWSRRRRREISSRGPPNAAWGRMNVAGGTQTGHSQMSQRYPGPGRSRRGFEPKPESSCLQIPNALEKARFQAGWKSHPVLANGNHWDDWDGAGVHRSSTECRAIALILQLSP